MHASDVDRIYQVVLIACDWNPVYNDLSWVVDGKEESNRLENQEVHEHS